MPEKYLQQRSHEFVAGLDRAFSNGLSLESVKELRAEQREKHQDLELVFMGLKPVAGFLDEVFRVYTPISGDADYLSFLPSQLAGTESDFIQYNAGTKNIWNTEQARKVVEERLSLLDEALEEDPILWEFMTSTGEYNFGRFLDRLGNGHHPHKIAL